MSLFRIGCQLNLKPASSLLIICCLFAVQAMAQDLPSRKAGLWEVKVSADGMPSPSTVQQCVDAKTDQEMMQATYKGMEAAGGDCTTSGAVKTSSGFETTTTCSVMGSKIVSKASFSGDFKESYEGMVVSTIDPPLMGQSGNTVKIVGKRTGACPAGLNPGEVQSPGGKKINLQMLAKSAKAMNKQMEREAAELMKKLAKDGAGGQPAR